MKAKKLVWATAVVAGMLMFTACSDKDNPQQVQQRGEPASLIIGLVGNPSTTRAAVAASNEEKAIKNFSVYVFDNAELLEKKEVITDGTLTKRIEGLTSGQKTIVLLTNMGTYPDVTNLDGIKAISFIDLKDQYENYKTNGFVMSGQKAKTLSAGINNETIPVERIVSKVKLGTITFANPLEAPHEADKLELTDAYIMKAIKESRVNAGTVVTQNPVYGGMASTVSTSQLDSLAKEIVFDGGDPTAATTKLDAYFYILPQAETKVNPTLLTLKGTYDGTDMYFPFRINEIMKNEGTAQDPVMVGYGAIERNKVYTINVTFARPGAGSSHPESPLDPAVLNVTIEAADWEGVDPQDVTW